MANDLMTAGAMAKALKVSDGKVKKAIAALKLKPVEKKGVCSYFSAAQCAQVKKALAS